MKKFLFTVIFAICLLLPNSVFAVGKPFTFMGRDFYLENTKFDKNYGMLNTYYSPFGYEQSEYSDGLIFKYATPNYSIPYLHKNIMQNYSDVISTIKVSENRIAFSFLQDDGDTLLYRINLVEPNSIAGVNNAQIIINVPLGTDIKTLDDKYFDAFFDAKFPPVFDEAGHSMPKLYSVKFDNTNFILKYSMTERGDFSNYYLPKKETFTDYKKMLRVNYRTDRIKPKKLVKQIINSKQGGEGFKVLTNKNENGVYIFSYVMDVAALSKEQMFTSYSIFKFEPYKRGLKSLEFKTYIPKNEKTEKKIELLEAKYNEILTTYEIPLPVGDIFGSLPYWTEEPYYEIYHGIK